MNTLNFYLDGKLINPEPIVAEHSNHVSGTLLTFSDSFEWIKGGQYQIIKTKRFPEKAHQDLEIIKIDS